MCLKISKIYNFQECFCFLRYSLRNRDCQNQDSPSLKWGLVHRVRVWKKGPSLTKTESESVIETRKVYESANPTCSWPLLTLLHAENFYMWVDVFIYIVLSINGHWIIRYNCLNCKVLKCKFQHSIIRDERQASKCYITQVSRFLAKKVYSCTVVKYCSRGLFSQLSLFFPLYRKSIAHFLGMLGGEK